MVGDNVVWRSYRDQWLSEGMTQERIPDSETWFTPLPLVITFSKRKVAVVPIAVEGMPSPVRIKLPGRPQKG